MSEMNSKLSDNYSYIEYSNPLQHNYSFLDNNLTNEITQHLNQQKNSNNRQNNVLDNFRESRDNDPHIRKSIRRT